MESKKQKYITTPIYYVNDVPHIGHCYTTIIGDILARFYRLQKQDVYYLTGTDEHGQKIEKAAEQKGLRPKELVDQVVERYQELWKTLNISNDYFIRTTDAQHKIGVQQVLEKVYSQGDIYLGDYEGWYCRPCETYFTATQLIEGNCPDCNRPVELLKEEAYFFRLSKYQQKILEHIKNNPNFILPESRKNEVISFVESGLNDLCISRTTMNWGIEMPELDNKATKKHYVYVWFDALLNYLTALGYPQQQNNFKYWPADVHLIGKDILKFHAVIWPAMLMSMGEKLPKHVFGHGFIYQSGEKMSKSKGNVLDPYNIIELFGVDAFRYYLAREIVFGMDGNYSEETMKQRYNSDLANDFGNLLNRSLNMMKKYYDLKIPEYDTSVFVNTKTSLKVQIAELAKEIPQLMDDFKVSIALEKIFGVIRAANKFIEDSAPWVLSKNEQTEQLAIVMTELMESIRILAMWLYPVMPMAVEQSLAQLNVDKNESIENPYLWGFFKKGHQLREPMPIFPRKL